MISSSASAHFKSNDAVVTRTIVGETLLVPITGDLANMQELFVLNETGAFLWQRMDGTRGIDELCAELVAEFDVERQQALEDLVSLLDELATLGLVETVDA